MDYETIDAELQELTFTLRGADEAVVKANMTRLRGMAEQISDDQWRRRALQRIEKLPALIAGPQPGKSPQYSEAVILVARVHGDERPLPERIAEAERTKAKVAELARQAHSDERMTILRMNSSIARLIEYWQIRGT